MSNFFLKKLSFFKLILIRLVHNFKYVLFYLFFYVVSNLSITVLFRNLPRSFETCPKTERLHGPCLHSPCFTPWLGKSYLPCTQTTTTAPTCPWCRHSSKYPCAGTMPQCMGILLISIKTIPFSCYQFCSFIIGAHHSIISPLGLT